MCRPPRHVCVVAQKHGFSVLMHFNILKCFTVTFQSTYVLLTYVLHEKIGLIGCSCDRNLAIHAAFDVSCLQMVLHSDRTRMNLVSFNQQHYKDSNSTSPHEQSDCFMYVSLRVHIYQFLIYLLFKKRFLVYIYKAPRSLPVYDFF